jgi:two-component system response regulator MtrA
LWGEKEEAMAQILLIEDDVQVRTVVRLMLTEAGYTVLEAGDTHDGLAVARAYPIDLIILDLLLPGQGGYHIIREVKALHPQMKVLAISGGNVFTAVDLLRSATEVGADRTLAKPMSQAELLDTVRALLTTPSA